MFNYLSYEWYWLVVIFINDYLILVKYLDNVYILELFVYVFFQSSVDNIGYCNIKF